MPTENAAHHHGALRNEWYRKGWYSQRTCLDALESGAAETGDAVVVFFADGKETNTTIGEIHQRALAVAGGMQRLGVRPGDAVAVQLTNRVECAVAFQAVLLCGAVLVPIVHIYGPNEVSLILADSGAKLLMMPAQLLSVSYMERLKEYARLDTLQFVVVVDAEPGQGYLTWPELTGHVYRRPDPDADDVAVLIYTSGTTSAPKGVQHSHNSLLAEQASLPELIAGAADSVQLVIFPFGHIGGMACLLRPLISGDCTVFLDRWDPVTAAGLISRYRVTAIAGTPFHLEGLLALGADVSKLATLREFLVGAATVTEELGRRAAVAGITTFRCYGLTEHPTVSCGRPNGSTRARLSTDGLLMRGCGVRILGSDGADLPVGADGEVVVQGPDQFIGYRNQALNSDAFTADGWFRTGDLGHLDGRGYLSITDRIKDVIIRAGETISAGQVEDVLNSHPSVAEGAVVAAPDPRYGDVVAAVVALRPGATLDIDKLRRHYLASGLATQKTPEHLIIVDSLPRTSTGKVRKAELRRSYF